MTCAVCSSENAGDAIQCGHCGATLVARHDPSALPQGTLLHQGAYAIAHCVGHGGFGITYAATDQRLRRPVAIKEFFPSGCVRQGSTVVPSGGWTPPTYQDGRARFVLEGEALARFDHPGIVRVHAAFEENDTAYIVMEYLQGKTLEQIQAERGGRLSVPEARLCVARIGAALEIVHGAGLLHRDIKPGNVMVVGSDSLLADPRVVLVDFGTAREFVAGMPQTHSVVLTQGYAPLEQYTRQAARGAFTDVYALAALLYDALTGAPPPEAPERACGNALQDLRQLNPEVDEALGRAVMRGLEMEAARRPQTVREFLAELDGAPPTPAHRQVPTVVPAGWGPGPAAASSSGPAASGPDTVAGRRHVGPLFDSLPKTVVAVPCIGGTASPGAMVELPDLSGMGADPTLATRPRQARFLGWGLAAAVLVLGSWLCWLAWGGRAPVSGPVSSPNPLVAARSPESQPNLGPTSAAPTRSTPADAIQPTPARSPAIATPPSPASTQPASAAPAGLVSAGTNAEGFPQFTNEKDGTVLVQIPGGTFQMGSDEYEDETPPHGVTLSPYLLARVPVTNAQYAQFVSATQHDAGTQWQACAQKWGDQAPVVYVSYDDATAYATWAGLRLPTEEEWEFAARGAEGLVYPWGNDWDASRCKNSVGVKSAGAAPVGSFASGASPFGCLDMAGNVFQWTASWYDRYPGNKTANDLFGEKVGVFRGGSWSDETPDDFRGAYRGRGNRDDEHESNQCGFRCARSLP